MSVKYTFPSVSAAGPSTNWKPVCSLVIVPVGPMPGMAVDFFSWPVAGRLRLRRPAASRAVRAARRSLMMLSLCDKTRFATLREKRLEIDILSHWERREGSRKSVGPADSGDAANPFAELAQQRLNVGRSRDAATNPAPPPPHTMSAAPGLLSDAPIFCQRTVKSLANPRRAYIMAATHEPAPGDLIR